MTPFPQTFSFGPSNMPRHWRTGLVFAQTNLTVSQEPGPGSTLMWGSHILTGTLTTHQEGLQHADVSSFPCSIPSSPSEIASKRGLNLEPESFKVSRKLFYHSKISVGCWKPVGLGSSVTGSDSYSAVWARAWHGERGLSSTELCRRSHPPSLRPPALQADAQLERCYSQGA